MDSTQAQSAPVARREPRCNPADLFPRASCCAWALYTLIYACLPVALFVSAFYVARGRTREMVMTYVGVAGAFGYFLLAGAIKLWGDDKCFSRFAGSSPVSWTLLAFFFNLMAILPCGLPFAFAAQGVWYYTDISVTTGSYLSQIPINNPYAKDFTEAYREMKDGEYIYEHGNTKTYTEIGSDGDGNTVYSYKTVGGYETKENIGIKLTQHICNLTARP
jgi:hypothetical protein